MGITLVAAGCLFLFNPNVGLFDFLPDIIGYLLIFIGLRRLSLVYNTFAETKRKFGVLCFVGVGKLACSIFDYYAVKEDKAGITTSLVLVFAFFIIEMICLVPAFTKLLDSLTYSGSLNGGEAVFKKEKGVRRLTVVFFILRALMPVIPHLTALSNFDNLGYVGQGLELDFSKYRRLFTVISVLTVLILGTIWLVRILLYFSRIRKDKAFILSLKNEYDEKLSLTPFVFIRKAIMLSTLLLLIASVFNFDFYVALNDHSTYDEVSQTVSSFNYNWGMVNIIPDVISTVIYVVAVLCGFEVFKNRAALVVTSVLYTVSSALAYASELIFNSKYVMDDILISGAAEDAYMPVVLSNALKFVCFIAFFIVLTVSFGKLTDEHTGIAPLNPDGFDSKQLILLHRNLKAKLWVSFGVTTASGIASFITTMMMPYYRSLWMVDIVFTAIQISVFYYALNSVRKEAESRYN